MSKALFLCRGQNGLDQVCVGALAKALALDANADAPTRVSDRRFQADRKVLATLHRRDRRLPAAADQDQPAASSANGLPPARTVGDDRQMRLPWPSGQVPCRQPAAVIFADSRVRRTS
jgi:hypothetical protein